MTGDKPRCGGPTKRGGMCRQYPMGASDRCYVHQGLPPTQAEQASRGQTKHSYFVSGFLNDEGRELFAKALKGVAEVGELKQGVIAALIVRANRMTQWEAESQPISGFANELFGELRKALDSVTPDELRAQHRWDDAGVAVQVDHVLSEGPELLVRLVPPEVQDTVREGMYLTG